ncbi:hypothetical protein ABZ635_16090 [Nocardiopsis sp. NPDC007018]|uniref:SCO4225 family membrane protein n=1 Tax=Nocardiopsis sp. NPDC007018 TaxID=3155721 RepID=UPI0033FD0AC8
MRHILAASIDNRASRVYLALATTLLTAAVVIHLGPGFGSGMPELALAVWLLPCSVLSVLTFAALDTAGMPVDAQAPVFLVLYVLGAYGNGLLLGLAVRGVRSLAGRRRAARH